MDAKLLLSLFGDQIADSNPMMGMLLSMLGNGTEAPPPNEQPSLGGIKPEMLMMLLPMLMNMNKGSNNKESPPMAKDSVSLDSFEVITS